MIKMLNITIVCFVIFVIFSPFYLYSGWVITEETTDRFNNRFIQTIFIEGNHIRYETSTSIAIIDLNKSEISMIFPQYRVYWKGTVSELRESTVIAYDAELEKMLAGVPDNQRKELDSIYQHLRNEILEPELLDSNISIEIVKTGLKDTILEYPVEKYNVLSDSILIESFWFSSVFCPYNEIDLKKMNEFMSQVDPNANISISSSEQYLKILSQGAILKTEEIRPNNMGLVSVVTDVREVIIPNVFFLPPENYRFAQLSDILRMVPVEMNENE